MPKKCEQVVIAAGMDPNIKGIQSKLLYIDTRLWIAHLPGRWNTSAASTMR